MNTDFVPNSFQTPNAYVDRCMAFLTPEEWKVLSYFCRRIFGFQKRQDRVSISQLADGIVSEEKALDYGTGLSDATIRKCLKSLESFGLLVEVEKNDPHKNQGPLYELQLDGDKIRLAELMARSCMEDSKAAEKMAHARACRTTPSNGITGGQEPTPSNTIAPPPSNGIRVPPSNAITPPPSNGIRTQNPVLNPVQKTDQKGGPSLSSNFWPKIQGQLRPEISKALYETWIAPTRALGWEGDTLLIACCNQYGADWLTSRIETSASRMLQGFSERPAARVRFVVGEGVNA